MVMYEWWFYIRMRNHSLLQLSGCNYTYDPTLLWTEFIYPVEITRLHPQGKGGPEGALVQSAHESSDRTPGYVSFG